jgi:hypothetical protein
LKNESFRAYYSPVRMNLWDSLPEEVQELILIFKKPHDYSMVIQRHYRKVRYSPKETPEMMPGKGQRVLVHFYKKSCIGQINRSDYGLHTNWTVADVVKGVNQISWYNQPPAKGEWVDIKHVTVKWYYYKVWNMSNGDIIHGKYYQDTVWFNPKDRPYWACGQRYNHIYTNRDLYDHILRPALVVLIKKW